MKATLLYICLLFACSASAQQIFEFEHFSGESVIKNIVTRNHKAYCLSSSSRDPFDVQSVNTRLSLLDESGNSSHIRISAPGATSFGANHMVMDKDGNLVYVAFLRGSAAIVCGDTVDLAMGNGTNGDFFLVKQDTLGNCIWAKRFFSNTIDNINVGRNLAIDSDNNIYADVRVTYNYTSVYNQQDTFHYGSHLAKFNENGDLLWQKPLNLSLAFKPQGFFSTDGDQLVFFGATTDVPVVLGDSIHLPENSQILLRADSSGNYVAHVAIHSQVNQFTVDQNALYLAGGIYISYEELSDMCDTSNFYMPQGIGEYMPYILKLDLSFNCQWIAALHPSVNGSLDIEGIAVDHHGNIIAVTETHADTVTFYRSDGTLFQQLTNKKIVHPDVEGITVFKLNSTGEAMWAVPIPTTERVYFSYYHSVAVMPDNNIVVVGEEGQYVGEGQSFFTFITNTDTIFTNTPIPPDTTNTSVAFPEDVHIEVVQNNRAAYLTNSTGKTVTVQLISSAGQTLLKETHSAQKEEIKFPALAPGIYLLTVTTESGVLTEKVFIR